MRHWGLHGRLQACAHAATRCGPLLNPHPTDAKQSRTAPRCIAVPAVVPSLPSPDQTAASSLLLCPQEVLCSRGLWRLLHIHSRFSGLNAYPPPLRALLAPSEDVEDEFEDDPDEDSDERVARVAHKRTVVEVVKELVGLVLYGTSGAPQILC